MTMPSETFLLVTVLIAGFYMAWNIGANDVANAMGTSVGSGALTLKQAVIIAAVLEFSGAFFFGSHVSDTIQNGIVDVSIFVDKPLILVYGMLAALLASGIWLQIASYYGWPVSTTHSIVGAIIGFGFIYGGVTAIHWEEVAFIVASWLVSPLLGGIISFIIFTLLRQQIFYASNPVEKAKRLTPFLVFGVISILALIMLLKGLHSLNLQLTFWHAIGMSFGLGLVGSIISYFLVRGLQPNISDNIKAEYGAVEKIFGRLQIMSACLMAFAHGANDVANAIGPLSASVAVLTTNAIPMNAGVPLWALALGGFGIVVGLATWGWRVIETIGKKITELTPTRGFAAEFGAATTVVLASQLGLPISTTHTLVGSVIGVGLARGIEALDLTMTRDILISWAVTVPAGALLSIGLFYLIQAGSALLYN